MLHEVAANELMGLPHEYELSDDQRDCVDMYVQFVKEQLTEGTELYVENRFKLPYHPEFWGTADCVVVNGDDLQVIDFKAGRGIAVEVDYHGKLNPQLGFYTLGACSSLGKFHWDNITVSIVQPRFGGIKRRTTDQQELMELAKEMIDAAALAERDDPPFKAGSHCHFCLARATCSTLRDFVYDAARMDFDAVS